MAASDDLLRLFYTALSNEYGSLFLQDGEEIRALRFVEFMRTFESAVEPQFQIVRREPGTFLIPARITSRSRSCQGKPKGTFD